MEAHSFAQNTNERDTLGDVSHPAGRPHLQLFSRGSKTNPRYTFPLKWAICPKTVGYGQQLSRERLSASDESGVEILSCDLRGAQ